MRIESAPPEVEAAIANVVGDINVDDVASDVIMVLRVVDESTAAVSNEGVGVVIVVLKSVEVTAAVEGGETSKVDEVSEVEVISEVVEGEEVNKVDKADEIEGADEVDEVDEVDEIEEVDESNGRPGGRGCPGRSFSPGGDIGGKGSEPCCCLLGPLSGPPSLSFADGNPDDPVNGGRGIGLSLGCIADLMFS